MYKEIDTVYIDCDGVLTDGIYQISDHGDATKSFYTRDFYAIEQVLKAGLEVIIITQSNDEVIWQQLKRIMSNSDFWRNSFADKLFLLDAVGSKANYIEISFATGEKNWSNVAYIGDAENDLECIEKAGFSGCPTDAVPQVREKAMYQSDYPGGRGAVYEFCMYLLDQRTKEFKENKEIENA